MNSLTPSYEFYRLSRTMLRMFNKIWYSSSVVSLPNKYEVFKKIPLISFSVGLSSPL